MVEGVNPTGMIPSDLKDAHNLWFEGLLAEDTTILNRVLSDDMTLGFPGGDVMPRATFLSLLQSGELFYDMAYHEAVGFRTYRNAAIVTGRSNLAYRFKGNKGFERLSYTAVYVQMNGAWRMVAWHACMRSNPSTPTPERAERGTPCAPYSWPRAQPSRIKPRKKLNSRNKAQNELMNTYACDDW